MAVCDTVCAFFQSWCKHGDSPLIARSLWTLLAGRTFFLHQQLPETGTDRDQLHLQLQADRLVYGLYALSEEKTAMVEGKDL